MRFAALGLCLLLVAGGCRKDTQAREPEMVWHTTPEKWDEPRVFHTTFNEQWADRIQLAKEPVADVNETQFVSANGAYWFSLATSDTSEPAPHSATIRIYNERDDFLCVQLSDIKAGSCKASWISEKLLFVRVWLGRVLGVDLIVDVEKEAIIYQEMTNDGGIPFLQWQQSRTEQGA